MRKAKPPFTLPDGPIDQHEVQYFDVRGAGDDPYVVHVRCVYHAHSTWSHVFPDRVKENGLDFVDQWQVFVDGECSGRIGDGWAAILRGPWDGRFATYAEAKASAVRQLDDALTAARNEVTTITARVAKMHAEKGPCVNNDGSPQDCKVCYPEGAAGSEVRP